LKDRWIRQVSYLGLVLQFGLITLSNVFVGGLIGYLVVKYTSLGNSFPHAGGTFRTVQWCEILVKGSVKR